MADAARHITYTQPFGNEHRDLGAQPHSISALQRQLMRGDGGETQETKKQPLTRSREVEETDLLKEWWKLTESHHKYLLF